MNYVNLILGNWDSIATGALAVVGAFSVIAKLTPTPKDDAIAAKLVKFLDFLAMNKQRPDQTNLGP